MEPPAVGGTTSARSTLLGGCAVILVLAGGVVLLAFWLLRELTDGDGAARPEAPARQRVDGDERLTRSRRRELEVELAQVERDLEFARAQARVAIDPPTRGSWKARAEELEARRDEIERQLAR